MPDFRKRESLPLRGKLSRFAARQGMQAKRFEMYWKYIENLFAWHDEVADENLELQ